jgi:hypothetical protein
MKDKLVEYVVELNTNPEALEKHQANSKTAAQEFGLEQEDVKLITDENVDEIKARCASCTDDPHHHVVTFFK